MLLIKTLDAASSKQRLTLGDQPVLLFTHFNSRNNAWYIDIFSQEGDVEYISGLKVMPNQNLTGRYVLPEISNGNIWCIRQKNNFNPIGIDNLGEDKDYSLYWISSDEEESMGINEYIQL